MHITAELKRQMRHFGEVWDTDPLIQQQRGEHRRRMKLSYQILLVEG